MQREPIIFVGWQRERVMGFAFQAYWGLFLGEISRIRINECLECKPTTKF